MKISTKRPTVSVTEFRLGGKPRPEPQDTTDEGEAEGEAMQVDEEGMRSAVKDLCKALGVDPMKAPAVQAALDSYLSCAGLGDDDEEEPDADDQSEEGDAGGKKGRPY